MRRTITVIGLALLLLGGCSTGGTTKATSSVDTTGTLDSTGSDSAVATDPTTTLPEGTLCEVALQRVATDGLPGTDAGDARALAPSIGPCATLPEWVKAADRVHLKRARPDDALVNAACLFVGKQPQICQEAGSFYRQTLPVTTTTTTTTTTTAPPPPPPPPTTPPATAPPTTSPASGGTISQQQARKSAQSYLSSQSFSRQGLIEQLQYEGFSIEDATYAVDSLNVNWNDQAAKTAASYLSSQAFSHSGLVDQLIYEGFTPEQAEYGVSTTGL